MPILTALANLIRARAAYWELRLKRYDHDIIEQSRSRLEALQDRLTGLRNSGDPADALVADRMRDRIRAEKRFLKHLPNSSATPPGGDESADG